MQSITVTLRRDTPPDIFKKGDLVRIKRKKRVWGKITAIISSNNFTMKAVYRPAPKSKLNKKTIFSKKKGEIILLKKTKNNDI